MYIEVWPRSNEYVFEGKCIRFNTKKKRGMTFIYTIEFANYMHDIAWLLIICMIERDTCIGENKQLKVKLSV